MGNVMVTGAGGMIGGHLVWDLLDDGHNVLAVDVKPMTEWWQADRWVTHPAAHDLLVCGRYDLSDPRQARKAVDHAVRRHDDPLWIYHLAADMGGIGFIEENRAACARSVVMNVAVLNAAAAHGDRIGRLFYSSSACVYRAGLQRDAEVTALAEDDAYPAEPEAGYGEEKLFTESLCRYYREDFGVPTRVARFHNIYGPWGTWTGGREKAPAAVCRKVAEAVVSGRHEIEVWGDGEQTRSFCWVGDCVAGTRRLAASDVEVPVNIGSDELVTINELIDVVEAVAGVRLGRHYLPDAPKGVRGRNSDNTRCRSVLGWAPGTSLADGMEVLYGWVYDQVAAAVG